MTYEPPKPPLGCDSVEEAERKLTRLADELEGRGRSILAEAGPRFGGTAKEFFLAAIRARKQAGELALAREQRSHTEWLMREYQRTHGFEPPAPDRPRIKLKKDRR